MKWKEIKGYEGFYLISTSGDIKRLNRTCIKSNGVKQTITEKVVSTSLDNKGYMKVNLRKYGVKSTFRVHQLMAITFLNHKPNGNTLVVDHIDNNKQNNKLSNLQVITNRENLTKDKRNKTSKYRGVHFFKLNKKWRATITINKTKSHLGFFNTEFEAHLAYEGKLKEITI